MLSGDTSSSMSRCVKLWNSFSRSATNVDYIFVIILQKALLLNFVFYDCILLLGDHHLNFYLKCGE